MLLITTNEQLTALLPNIAVTVKGETPLIDKLAPFLNAAEQWAADTCARKRNMRRDTLLMLCS